MTDGIRDTGENNHDEFIGLVRLLGEGSELKNADDFNRDDDAERAYTLNGLNKVNEHFENRKPEEMTPDDINAGYGVQAKDYGEDSANLLKANPEGIINGIPDDHLRQIAKTEDIAKLANAKERDMLEKHRILKLLESVEGDYDSFNPDEIKYVTNLVANYKGKQDAKKLAENKPNASASRRALYETVGQLAVMEGLVDVEEFFGENEEGIIGEAKARYDDAVNKAGSSIIDYTRHKLVGLVGEGKGTLARELIYQADAGRLK